MTYARRESFFGSDSSLDSRVARLRFTPTRRRANRTIRGDRLQSGNRQSDEATAARPCLLRWRMTATMAALLAWRTTMLLPAAPPFLLVTEGRGWIWGPCVRGGRTVGGKDMARRASSQNIHGTRECRNAQSTSISRGNPFDNRPQTTTNSVSSLFVVRERNYASILDVESYELSHRCHTSFSEEVRVVVSCMGLQQKSNNRVRSETRIAQR